MNKITFNHKDTEINVLYQDKSVIVISLTSGGNFIKGSIIRKDSQPTADLLGDDKNTVVLENKLFKTIELKASEIFGEPITLASVYQLK